MKNESRFAEARKFALAAIAGLGAMLTRMANRPEPTYRSNRLATARPANLHAGSKGAKKATYGTVGAGMHSVIRKAPIAGVTFSPKRDIGKGPARTVPHGKRQAAAHFLRMRAVDAHVH